MLLREGGRGLADHLDVERVPGVARIPKNQADIRHDMRGKVAESQAHVRVSTGRRRGDPLGSSMSVRLNREPWCGVQVLYISMKRPMSAGS